LANDQLLQELHDAVVKVSCATENLQTADDETHFLECVERTAQLLRQLWRNSMPCVIGDNRYLASHGELEVQTKAGPYLLSRAMERSIPVMVGLQFVRDLFQLLNFVGLRSLALDLEA
jgi:hypothetical protein